MDKKRSNILILILFFLIFIFPSLAQIYLGTVDGYVFYMNGSPVDSAFINASVISCSNACSQATTTDVNGYYVIANLNLEAFGYINVSVFKDSYAGSAIGQADEFQAARVNITLCRPPTQPVLIDEQDSHIGNVTLEWTSGIDLDGYKTFDQLQLNNGVIINATSPYELTDLAFGSYIWKVRTCNALCCSPWKQDSFNIYNNPPSQPTLIPINDTHNTTITFEWLSGIDPEGDPTYDQFQLDDNVIINATSPLTFTNLSYSLHRWKVRTCDIYGYCSAWQEDSFTIGNLPPSEPIIKDIPNTQERKIKFEWTSGIDPEGDATYDEFQLSDKPDFTNILLDLNTSSPISKELDVFTIYYWRVRTCDVLNACSSWQEDSFFIYQCPKAEEIEKERIVYRGGKVVIRCEPKWQCYDWKCIDGLMLRKCIDLNECYEMPEVYAACKAKEIKHVGYLFIGNLTLMKIILVEHADISKIMYFYHKGNNTIKILKIFNNSIEFLLNDKIIEMKEKELRFIDLDNDGKYDIWFELIKLGKDKITFKLGLVKEAPRVFVSPRMLKSFTYIILVLAILFIVEFLIIIKLLMKKKS